MVTTAEQLGFMQSICESPADDLPRLVYADWLDENAGSVPCGRCEGQGTVQPPMVRAVPRGAHPMVPVTRSPRRRCLVCDGSGSVSDGRRERTEFIRVQCRCVTPAVTVSELARLSNRAYDLLGRWVAHWCPGGSGTSGLGRPTPNQMPGLDASARLEWCLVNFSDGSWFGFRRGFVSSLKLPWAAWAGGECVQCNGGLWIGMFDMRDGRCPAKCNSGRTPGVAESLYWALQPCSECEGRGYPPYVGGDDDDDPCPRCSSSGRVVPTVECRCQDCNGEGRIFVNDPYVGLVNFAAEATCQACYGRGTGRVPRPFPETAQPLERVVFTTWPVPGEDYFYTPGRDGRQAKFRSRQWHSLPIHDAGTPEWLLTLLTAEWPGIEFVLPTAGRE